MTTYTYQCEECGMELHTQEHKDAPFTYPHEIAFLGDKGAEYTTCNGLMYRKWQATAFYIKDHSSSNWE